MYLTGAVPTVTWNKLNMHRSSTGLLGFGVLALVACGAPAELDDSRFPLPEEAGYADLEGPLTGVGGASGAAPVGAAGGANMAPVANPPGAGVTPAPAPPAAGAGGAGAAAPPAGAGGSNGGTPAAAGSANVGAGMGGAPMAAGGAPAAAGGCPDDITVLFDRPIEQGGCNGAACHIPGATAPDLVSPGIEARLVGVTSQCQQRPYIGPDDSFLAEKIAGSPACGLAMPFFMPQALSAADEACILDWIDEVSGG